MKRKKEEFDPSKEIEKTQTIMICELLRLLPEDGTPVDINQMFFFLNKNSYFANAFSTKPKKGFTVDGFKIESVRLIAYGHYVEIVKRKLDYDKIAEQNKDVSEITPADDLFKETEAFVPQSNYGDFQQLELLATVYRYAKEALAENE